VEEVEAVEAWEVVGDHHLRGEGPDQGHVKEDVEVAADLVIAVSAAGPVTEEEAAEAGLTMGRDLAVGPASQGVLQVMGRKTDVLEVGREIRRRVHLAASPSPGHHQNHPANQSQSLRAVQRVQGSRWKITMSSRPTVIVQKMIESMIEKIMIEKKVMVMKMMSADQEVAVETENLAMKFSFYIEMCFGIFSNYSWKLCLHQCVLNYVYM